MSKCWFKIGEAAKLIGVGPKDLRYWETQIPEIKPRRSKGNLRYYHTDEMPRLHRIHGWMQEGLTVRDCRELLLTGHLARGLHSALGIEAPEPIVPRKPAGPKTSAAPAPNLPQEKLEAIWRALKQLHHRLSEPWNRE